MVGYARRLTERDAEGRATRFGTTLRSMGVMIDVNWVFGGEFLTPESYQPGGKWESALFSPENINAYQAVLDVFYADRVAPNPTDNPGWAGEAGSLLDGRLAMDWTGWWAINQLVRSDTSWSFGLAPPPKAVARKATLFNDPWFMSSKTDNPEAAWEFIKFATSPEALMKYSEVTGTPPARCSSFVEGYAPSFAEQLGLPPIVLMESFMGSVEYGVYRHQAADMGVELFITPYLLEIVKQEVPLQSGLEEAHRHLNRFLAEQQDFFENRNR